MKAATVEWLSSDDADRSPGVGRSRDEARSVRERRRRGWSEGTAAVLVGTVTAIGWAVAGTLDERRMRLEREWGQLAPAMAEHARLERMEESARAAAREAQQRLQPYAALLALLEAVSGEADAGVTISRLQLSRDEIELQLDAADSATAAAWAERLATIPGTKLTQAGDLRLTGGSGGGRTQRPVQATVRFRLSDAERSAPRRGAIRGEHTRAARGGERSDG